MGRDQGSTEVMLKDQRRRWTRGDRVRVEQFLEQYPEARANADLILDLIYAEVLLRREAGETPRIAEYLERFPELADPIRLQFEVDDAIGPTRIAPESDPTDPDAVPAPIPPPPAPPGYQILSELGHGGMGVVYLARHIGLDRLTALKMIRSGALADPDDRKRFEGEARAAAQLSHPNVVQVYEVGETNHQPFLALEYVSGGTLADALRGPPFPPRPAAALAATLARAIQHAHDHGIVHRDLKPANVLLAVGDRRLSAEPSDTWLMSDRFLQNARPKITDFGLAKRVGADGPTVTGAFVGTPNFAAPEQAAGREVGPAADVWSLGGILYMMLTGRPPFAGANAMETLDQVRHNDPVPPSKLRPNVPSDLETIALACLRKDPARRYSSAGALADDLDRFLDGKAIRARPVGTIERVGKWCRRRPAVAGLIAAIIVLASAALITTTALWQSAASARDSEIRALMNERAQRERAEIRSADLLIANARYAWQTDDLETAQKLLTECPPERRSAAWAELDRSCSAVRLILKTSTAAGETVTYSQDGKFLASGNVLGKIHLWNAATGELLKVLDVPNRTIQSLAFTADGTIVVVGHITYRNQANQRRDVTEIGIINPETNKIISHWERPDRPIRCILSPNGQRVVCVSNNSPKALVADTMTGKVIHEYEASGNITRVAFSPDGRLLATGGLPKELSVWNVESGDLIQRYTLPGLFFGFQTVVAFNDGKRAAVSATNAINNGELPIIGPNGETVRLSSRLTQITEAVLDSAEQWCAAYSGSETAVHVWSVATGRIHITLRGYPTEVRHIAFHPNGRELAVGYRDGRVVIWKIKG
ncbi:MAG TPA: serine/threonine-protein kinase [Gemmataceae bacterium]|jgi:serine/threonine protein kinase|nr:serine/threonine-protein kinase [Gemmataceae bacterium]